jgi:hypothetical protein
MYKLQYSKINATLFFPQIPSEIPPEPPRTQWDKHTTNFIQATINKAKNEGLLFNKSVGTKVNLIFEIIKSHPLIQCKPTKATEEKIQRLLKGKKKNKKESVEKVIEASKKIKNNTDAILNENFIDHIPSEKKESTIENPSEFQLIEPIQPFNLLAQVGFEEYEENFNNPKKPKN